MRLALYLSFLYLLPFLRFSVPPERCLIFLPSTRIKHILLKLERADRQ